MTIPEMPEQTELPEEAPAPDATRLPPEQQTPLDEFEAPLPGPVEQPAPDGGFLDDVPPSRTKGAPQAPALLAAAGGGLDDIADDAMRLFGVRKLGEAADPALQRAAVARARSWASKVGVEIPDDSHLARYAGNINLGYIDDPEQFNSIIEEMARHAHDDGLLAEARGGGRADLPEGSVSQARTRELAEARAELGLTAEDLMHRRPGEAWNGEQILAARMLMAKSRDELGRLAHTIAGGNGDPRTLAMFHHRVATHAALQHAVHGAAAEAGRALAQFRMLATGDIRGVDLIESLRKIEVHKGFSAEDIARQIIDLERVNPRGVDAYARRVHLASSWDMLRESFVMGLLWAPSTQAVNILGNGLTAMWLPLERTVAGFAGSAERLARSSNEGVRAGEGVAMLHGYYRSMRHALKFLAYSIKTESTGAMQLLGGDSAKIASLADDTIEGSSKFDFRQRAISSETVQGWATRRRDTFNKLMRFDANPDDVRLGGAFAAGIDYYGKLTRIPGRFLGGMDEFFKTLNYYAQLESLAYRDVRERGLTGIDAKTEMERLIANPPPEISRSADAWADYATFTKAIEKDDTLGQLGAAAQRAAWPIVPFMRTPVNIVEFSFERLIPFLGEGGLPPGAPKGLGVLSDDPTLRQLAVGKASAAGMLLGVTAMTMAENWECAGDAPICFTGAGPPASQRTRADAMKRLGIRPYSVGVRGPDGTRTWYAYNRADPLGLMLGVMADVLQIIQIKDDPAFADDLGLAVITAAANGVVNKTYLQGLADFLDAVNENSNDPQRWAKATSRVGASFVPFKSAFAAVEREMDEAQRKVTTGKDPLQDFKQDMEWMDLVLQRIRSAMPSLSTELPPWRNAWGEVQYMDTMLHVQSLSPIYRTEERTGPSAKVDRAILDEGLHLRRPRSSIAGVQLDPWQFDRYQVLAGNGLKVGAKGGPPVRLQLFPRGHPAATVWTQTYDVTGLGFHDAATRLVNSDWWDSATSSEDPPGMRQEAWGKLVAFYRARARAALLSENEALHDRVRTSLVADNEATGMEPDMARLRADQEWQRMSMQISQSTRYDSVPEPLQPGEALNKRRSSGLREAAKVEVTIQ